MSRDLRGGTALWLILAVALPAGAATAPAGHGPQGGVPSEARVAFERSQAAIGRTLGDHLFADSQGRPVGLSELRGRPLVLSLVYTSCYHTCPTITQRLAHTAAIGRAALGEDSFTVVTLGFDSAHDTPERMAALARSQGIRDPRWHFVSADRATVERLTQEIGFTYAASPRGFDHIAQLTVIDAQGKVYRQVYGEAYDPPALVEPLKELVFGLRAREAGISGWVEGLKLFCTVYDPASGRYKFDYSILVSIFVGALSLGAVAIFIVRAWRQGSRARV
jgi:protein SCO1/2